MTLTQELYAKQLCLYFFIKKSNIAYKKALSETLWERGLQLITRVKKEDEKQSDFSVAVNFGAARLPRQPA